MTRNEITQIAENDLAFRERVLTELIEIRTLRRADCEDIAGIKRTLYGPTGSEGIVGVVVTLKEQVNSLKTLKTFNKALAIVQVLLGAILAALGWGKIH